MRKFLVTINIDGKFHKFTVTGERNALMDAAYQMFGACGIVMRPL